MPTIYRQYCDNCDTDGGTDVTYDTFAGAVIAPSPCGGRIISGHYQAYLDDDGNLVPLPHPVEDSALRSHGATWNNAALAGRLFLVTKLVCRKCGTMNESARLRTDTTVGCFGGLTFAGLGPLLAAYFKFGQPAAGVLAVLGLFTPSFLMARWISHRHGSRNNQYGFSACSNCGSSDAVYVYNATRQRLICPRCEQETMRVAIAGKS